MVVDTGWVQVDLGELLDHLIKQAGFGQPVNLGRKLEPFKDVADVGRKGLDVVVKVGPDVVLIAHQLFHVERRDVVEGLPCLAQKEGDRIDPLGGSGGMFGKDRILGRRKDAVEAAQDGQGQDDLGIIRLLVIAAQQVSDRPDEG